MDGARNWSRTSTGYYPTRSLVLRVCQFRHPGTCSGCFGPEGPDPLGPAGRRIVAARLRGARPEGQERRAAGARAHRSIGALGARSDRASPRRRIVPPRASHRGARRARVESRRDGSSRRARATGTRDGSVREDGARGRRRAAPRAGGARWDVGRPRRANRGPRLRARGRRRPASVRYPPRPSPLQRAPVPRTPNPAPAPCPNSSATP